LCAGPRREEERRKNLDGTHARELQSRGYGAFPEIRNMIARTAFTQLRYSFLLLAVALAGLFVTFILPWFSFLSGEDPAWFLASTAICLMTVTFGLTVRFYTLPWPWALTLPVAAAYYGYATCVSPCATGSVAAANGRVVSKHHAETSSHDAASKFVVLRIEICYSAQR